MPHDIPPTAGNPAYGPGVNNDPAQRAGLVQGSSMVPARNQNMTPAEKLKFLKTWGWAVGDKWDARAKAAWKNYMAANATGTSLAKAAAYWSKNSKLSASYTPGHAPPSPTGPVSNPAADAYSDYLAGGQQLSATAMAGLARDAAALAAAIPRGQKITAKQLNAGLKGYDPSLLDDMAGTSTYDATVSSINDAIAQAKRDTDANVGQIGGWYDTVGKSLATAAGRDKAIQAASLGSVTDAAKAVASAIGGEANPGASMAAQAGAQGAGLVAAMGAANDEFNSDIAPLIQAEGVGRQADERAAGADRVSQLVQQVAQIRAQQSQGMGDARLKLAQMNNDLANQRGQNLLTALQYNSGLDQQQYQNLASVAAQRAQLASLGIDAYGKFGPDAPDPVKPVTPKAPKLPSTTDLRKADESAFNNVDYLRKNGKLSVAAGVRTVKAAYGISSSSPRAVREAAFRSAVNAMPNVPAATMRKFFSLG